MRAAILAVVVALFPACQPSQPAESLAGSEIADVLASPAAYDGKLIRLRGAAIVRFEASFICPAPETLDSPGSSKKCLALAPGEAGGSAYDIRQLDGKTVEIIGRFNSKAFGHMGAYGGTIYAIWGTVTGSHTMREAPPPVRPPGSSANNSSKPTPLRGAA